MASNIPDYTQSNDASLSSESRSTRNVEDKIYEEIKKAYFIDVNCQEMLDLRGAVEKYLTKLTEANELQGFRIEKLVRGGSMTENTRLWQYDRDFYVEFDYLAIMSRNELEFVNQEYCPGFIQVLDKTKTKHAITFENKNFVYGPAVGFIFSSKCWDIIKKWDAQGHSPLSKTGTHEILETRAFSHDRSFLKEVLSNEYLRASQRIIDTKSGILLNLSEYKHKDDSRGISSDFRFVWVRKVQHQESSTNFGGFADCAFNVDVDFLPAYEYECDSFHEEHAHVFKSIENLNSQDQMSEGPSHVRYILPKICHKDNHAFCWKVSTMFLEQALIKRSEIQLDAYKLLKFFMLDSRFELIVTSYMLKTVFLLHLKECASSEGSVKGCFHAMLHSLYKMCMDGCIPHFFYGSYNLFTKLINSTKHRCEDFKDAAELIHEIQLSLTNADSVFKDGWCLETLHRHILRRKKRNHGKGWMQKTKAGCKKQRLDAK